MRDGQDEAIGDIINLRRVRKAKARDAAVATASANRAAHGRTKSEKEAAATDQARRDALLDGAAIQRRPDDLP